MFRLATAAILAALLTLAGGAVVMAQTAMPTPQPGEPAPTPDVASYEAAALEQLGNLRIVATDLYPMTGIPTSTAQSHLALIRDEVMPFANNTTPPPDFAPFHVLLFMSVRPCGMSAAYIQQGQTDMLSAIIASSYIQACYRSVSDASVEWARVTHTVPIFQARATPAASAAAEPTASSATPVAAPTAGNDAPEQSAISQTVDGVTVALTSLKVLPFDEYQAADPEGADDLAYYAEFPPAAVGILSISVANHSDQAAEVIPIQFAAVVVAGEQIDLSSYRLISTGDLDTTYYPGAAKQGSAVFALSETAWSAISGGAQLTYYASSRGRDYVLQIEPSLP